MQYILTFRWRRLEFGCKTCLKEKKHTHTHIHEDRTPSKLWEFNSTINDQQMKMPELASKKLILLWLDKNHWIQDFSAVLCPKCYCLFALIRNSTVPWLDIGECFIIAHSSWPRCESSLLRTLDKHAPSWLLLSVSELASGSPPKIARKARWELFLSSLLTMLSGGHPNSRGGLK